MKNIAAIFSSATLILMAFAAQFGFRFRDILLYWQHTPRDKYFPSEPGVEPPVIPLVHLEVIVRLIRIAIILSLVFIYFAYKENKIQKTSMLNK
ncbi:hypothetical protein I4Q36_06200 [Tuanshanicoccus lijuaniae]|uniref:hypothetical protein n=1 Tax=Aerococcaceae bacterium zg-1292 TaxID=2774330 RepID=UPI001935A4E6|nr:hypothetical protein [Aerococcaceae bacterium zg-1292]MBF6977710.1 hypothetical protein [Aerococcaceae bacterium zg-BR22]QQA36410.1 hypothetical protein I4Q36_06200 [Aerococcaceae bacterium zg-1292]